MFSKSFKEHLQFLHACEPFRLLFTALFVPRGGEIIENKVEVEKWKLGLRPDLDA